MCHNNIVIIDVKTFWRPFLLISWRKSGTVHKNCSYFKVTHIIVNGCYWNTCNLECAMYSVHSYPDSHSCVCESRFISLVYCSCCICIYSRTNGSYVPGYRGGSPTAVGAWQPCPLWEPSPSHFILM